MKHYLQKLEEITVRCWDKASLCDYGGDKLTYGQVATSIARFHLCFEKAGIKKGDKIALCAKNSARWAVSFLAVNTYEAVIVPILADFHPDSVVNLVNHSESMILFTDADIWAKLDPARMPGLKMAVSTQDFSVLYCKSEVLANAYASLDEEFTKKYPNGLGKQDVHYPHDNFKDLAIINYTSGTTSDPKGVMLTYEAMSDTVDFSQSHMPNSPEDNIVSMLPLAHMYGLAIEFIYPCCSGCAIYFLGKTPSPSLLLKAMKDVQPYMVVTVPLVMEKVYKSSIKPVISKPAMKVLLAIPGVNGIIYKKVGEKLTSAFGGKVRVFIMGGAALNPEVEKCFKKIKLHYTVGYGMTEACPLLGYEAWDKFVPGSCGKPVHDVRIDSEDPQKIAGEIQARGANITIGYFKNPEANAMAFTEDGWLRTGDLGIMDKDGNIFIKGRSKSMILSANGQNIYPEELEAIVNNQPYAVESVVVDRAGKIVAMVYLDTESMKKDGLSEEDMAEIPEKIRINSNRQLPLYSQIAKVEVVRVPFEKTPKMSIKRFLYK